MRSIGSDLHMDYTAVGQTTHLAARMEQLTRPGVTLVTGQTLRLAEGYVEVSPVGPVPVKGLSESVAVYELLGAGPVRSRLQASAARGLTPFVGRESELEQLRQTLDRARGGHGQVVALVGEPGVGKSRLLWEFTHSHRTHGWLILESGAVSYGRAHVVPAGGGPAARVLPDRGPGRPPEGAREGDGQAPHPGRVAPPHAARVPDAPRRARRRPRLAGPRPAAPAPAHPRGGEAAPAPRGAGAAGAAGGGEPAVGGHRDAGVPGQPRGEPAHRALHPGPHVPAGVPARVGAAAATTPRCGWIRSRRPAPRASCKRSSATIRRWPR